MTAVLIRAPRPAEAQHPPVFPGVGDSPTTHVRHDIVEEWGVQSFPASDPPSNWSRLGPGAGGGSGPGSGAAEPPRPDHAEPPRPDHEEPCRRTTCRPARP